jgi:hypothetical protein
MRKGIEIVIALKKAGHQLELVWGPWREVVVWNGIFDGEPGVYFLGGMTRDE